MAGHTPGPWLANLHHAKKQGGRIYGFIHAGEVAPIAAVVLSVEGMSQDEGRANARLIAAAPELLAALERVLGSACLHPSDMDGEARTAMALARAAIA